jgi:hypothetical protein
MVRIGSAFDGRLDPDPGSLKRAKKTKNVIGTKWVPVNVTLFFIES